MLLTESGYLMLVKSFTDDLAGGGSAQAGQQLFPSEGSGERSAKAR